MFLIRRAKIEDVPSLLKLAKMVHFINLPAEQVDQEIEAELRRLVEFLDLDRSTLFQLAADGSTMVLTHSWAKPGFAPFPSVNTREQLPWALKQVLEGKTIVYSSVDDLPAEAGRDKEIVHKFGPKSNVTFPLAAGGAEVFGALAFGKMSVERTWPENVVQRLRLVAQIIAKEKVEIIAALNRGLTPPDEGEIVRVIPKEPLAGDAARRWIVSDLPLHSLQIIRKGGQGSMDDTLYCYVNQHWVRLPSLTGY